MGRDSQQGIASRSAWDAIGEKNIESARDLCSTSIMREEEEVGKDGKRKKKAHREVPVGLQRL